MTVVDKNFGTKFEKNNDSNPFSFEVPKEIYLQWQDVVYISEDPERQ